ncbi:MAG: hypothetical protein RPR28_01395 [Cycloclasticus sp.]|jgi:hypothetical protein
MTLAHSLYEAMLANSRNLFEAMSGYNAEIIQLFQGSRVQFKEELDKRTVLTSETTSLLECHSALA